MILKAEQSPIIFVSPSFRISRNFIFAFQSYYNAREKKDKLTRSISFEQIYPWNDVSSNNAININANSLGSYETPTFPHSWFPNFLARDKITIRDIANIISVPTCCPLFDVSAIRITIGAYTLLRKLCRSLQCRNIYIYICNKSFNFQSWTILPSEARFQKQSRNFIDIAIPTSVITLHKFSLRVHEIYINKKHRYFKILYSLLLRR